MNNLALLLISNALASIGTGIAMIAVPWYLASLPDGILLFSKSALYVNIFLFILMPLVGPIVDNNSRKKLMIIIRLGFIFGLIVIFISIKTHPSPNNYYPLLGYYALGSLFYAINVPLRTAFVQELFSEHEYVRVNSILEIENQIAAVLTGALAVLAIKKYGMGVIVIMNILLYMLALIAIILIKYTQKELNVRRLKFVSSLHEGIKIAKEYPYVSIVLMACVIPYVVIILYTVIHPIALSLMPNVGGESYALLELLFGLGAIISGVFLLSDYPKKFTTTELLIISMSSFLIITIVQLMIPSYWGFLIIAIAFGFSNSFVRVVRQSYLMENINNKRIGRIGTLLQSWIMFLRSTSLAILTYILSEEGIIGAIALTVTISVIALVTLFIALYMIRLKKIKSQIST